jgi:hypothetical protein
MSTWRGDRGVAIANRLVQMANHGCRIKILYGQSSPRVTGLLRWHDRRGRISVRGTAFDRDFDGEADLFAHAKYMTLRGRWKDDRTSWVTWTGSSNWSDGGLRGDELVFRIKGKSTHRRYVRNFSDISRTRSYYSSRSAFDLATGARSPSLREPTFHDD